MSRSSTGCASSRTDRICQVLSDPVRRRVLSLLLHRRGPINFDRLVNSVVESERRTDRDWSREELRIGLHHVHLPKLVDAELVSRDRTRNGVRLTADRRRVARLLGALGDESGGADVVGESSVTVRVSKSVLAELEDLKPLSEVGGTLQFDAPIGAFEFVARLSEGADGRYFLCPARADSTFSLERR